MPHLSGVTSAIFPTYGCESNKYNNLFAICTLWCYIIRMENKNEFISKNKILAVQKEH
jgi:hypothetical protein